MFSLFGSGKNTVKSPQILVCSIGDVPKETDCCREWILYQAYRDVTEYQAADTDGLLAFVSGKAFDIVHILALVGVDGTISGSAGIELLKRLSNAGAKLIVFASGNTVESYVAAFPAKERIGFVEPNLVLTLERKGEKFHQFFSALFALMAAGRTMPVAWVKLAPQGGDSRRMEELPETIFEANLGQIKFVP